MSMEYSSGAEDAFKKSIKIIEKVKSEMKSLEDINLLNTAIEEIKKSLVSAESGWY